MNKAVVLALLLVSSEALGQIKSFKSGDRINADEMNQNFQELVDADAALKQRTDTLVDEMNQNLQELVDEDADLKAYTNLLVSMLQGEIDGLESAVTCDSNAVEGWWFTVVQNFADKGELVQANFKQGGTIEWSLITENARQSGSGTWSTDIECTVKATMQEPFRLGVPRDAGPTNLLAFLANDGKTMSGYLKVGTNYRAGTFSRSRYIRNYSRLPTEGPKTNQPGS